MALTDNLIEHWSLNNTRNGSSGAINLTAVGSGGADEAAGVLGRCFSYPGTSGRYDQFTYNSAIPEGTIAFCWKSQGDGSGAFHRVINKTQVGVTEQLGIGFNNRGRRPALNIADTSIIAEASDVLARDVWYRHVITWNGSVVKWYIDGVEAYSVNSTVGIAANTQPFTLGGWGGNGTQQGNGDLDEVIFLARAWSAAEVAQYYNSGALLEYPFVPLVSSGFLNFF